eukprot:COSAG01_NODE_2970_length_6775_cov_8.832235_1_plen_97_part_10
MVRPCMHQRNPSSIHLRSCLSPAVRHAYSRQIQPTDAAAAAPPPKTTIELYKRTDPEYIKIWDEALRKEWNGLCEREVFEHDLTKQQLYDRGILPGK